LTSAGHPLVSAHDLPDDNAGITRYDIPTDDTIFVTSPPWSRPVLHEIIVNLKQSGTAWLLLDADWVYTQLFGITSWPPVIMQANGRDGSHQVGGCKWRKPWREHPLIETGFGWGSAGGT
jgi:hypothetical protein